MRISDILPTGREAETHFTPFTTANPAQPSIVDEEYYFKKHDSELAAQEWTPRRTYGHLIGTVREISAGFLKDPPEAPDLEMLCEAVQRVMRSAASDRSGLLELTERSTPEDHLIGHIANVTVLSVALSQHLDWPARTQIATGVGALLHDAGLVRRQEDYLKARVFTQEERLIWNQYVAEGESLLADFFTALSPESRSVVQSIVSQTQERNNGKGSPNHLMRGKISPEARLVGLCDTYESFTHARPHRPRMLPFEALRRIMEYSGDFFDGGNIKSLLEMLTIFPPGSYVQLNTGEIARVIGLNRKLPVRPKVQIIATARGEAVRSEKTADLAENQEISIEKAVDECLLPVADAGLILELRTRRWWLG